jgi:tRNA A-37 threonylcarbamoyl transferase component Bud32
MSSGRAAILRGTDWAGRLLEALAQPPRDTTRWMEQHTRLLKTDRYSRVGLLELDGELSYLKFYCQKSLAQQLWFRMARGRGVRAFDMGKALAGCGVKVPEPRACLLVTQGMLLLTEALEGSSDLQSVWTVAHGPADPGGLLVSAGRVLGALHRSGHAHGDCKWSNLLWYAGTCYLVDLEGVRRTPVGGGRQARDLARFTLNAEELSVGESLYREFLAGYCDLTGTPAATAVDRLMPDLHKLRARHRKRYGERGTPLF